MANQSALFATPARFVLPFTVSSVIFEVPWPTRLRPVLQGAKVEIYYKCVDLKLQAKNDLGL